QPFKMGGEKDNKEFLDFPIGGASAVETASKTYIQIIKSPAIIGEVVHELGLDTEKEQKKSTLPDFLKSSFQTIKTWFSGMIAVLKYGRVIEDDSFAKAIKNVSSNLTMEAKLDTYTFEIKYTAEDPQQAADVANATAKTLVQFVNELRVS